MAVLGGGLTGLTTAYYLAKMLPKTTKITVYEASSRTGGWIRTDRVPVDVDGVQGTVQFERGPRTLSSLHTSSSRFDDLILYDLALDLGLRIESPPEQPRYICYNNEVVRLPPHASLLDCLSQPLFVSAIPAVMAMVYKRIFTRVSQEELGYDFSVADFTRRIGWGNALADNFASAMIHGIYGGDIEKLSAQSVLGDAVRNWYLPKLPRGNAYMRFAEEKLLRELGDVDEIRRMAWKANGALLHFGEKGMESLPKALADALAMEDNVEIKLNAPVAQIQYEPRNETVMVVPDDDAGSEKMWYDKVISTINPQALHTASRNYDLGILSVPAVSIMTVNMWYPMPDLKPPGFGYLIPRSATLEDNPSRALGVFFDSDVGVRGKDEPEGTKLFVLSGGHFYESGEVALPTEEQAIENAKDLLERHLGIPRDTPCHAMARLAEDCIPQHYVGHMPQMAKAHAALMEGYAGKLGVAGGWYTKIGAMGALRAGYDAAMNIVNGQADRTGLEEFAGDGAGVVAVPRANIGVRRSGYVQPPKDMV